MSKYVVGELIKAQTAMITATVNIDIKQGKRERTQSRERCQESVPQAIGKEGVFPE